MNRRAFLARLGVGGAAVVAGVAVSGAVGGPLGRLGAGSPAEAVAADAGVELVVNGSFEDSAPGADIAGWQVLV